MRKPIFIIRVVMILMLLVSFLGAISLIDSRNQETMMREKMKEDKETSESLAILAEIRSKNKVMIQELDDGMQYMERTVATQDKNNPVKNNVYYEVSRGSVIDRDFKISSPSGATAKEIDNALKGTNLGGLGESFVRAEKNYGINAIFLTALAIEESGWGTSNFAVNRNNLFGLGAYTSDPSQALMFKTKDSCIDNAGKLLKRDYSSSDGKYYRGGRIQDVNRVYASNPKWSSNILRIMRELEAKRG